MGGPVYATIYGPLTLLKTKWSDHGTQSRNKNAEAEEQKKGYEAQKENGYEEKILVKNELLVLPD